MATIIIITGDTRDKKIITILQQYGIGRMWVDRPIKLYKGEPWGFDNGAFRDWKNGLDFNETVFLQRLEQAYSAGKPYIAIVPDVVAGGLKSLEFSLDWLPKLPQEYPWYLAVQDGMKIEDIEPILNSFTGIFLGGTDKFKSTAYWWCKLAHKHGKKFHYGRAGTPRKLRHAIKVGSDSADSAFPLWERERFKVFINTWKSNTEQIEFWGPEVWSIKP